MTPEGLKEFWKERGLSSLFFAETVYTTVENREVNFDPSRHKVRTKASAEIPLELDPVFWNGKPAKELNAEDLKELRDKLNSLQWVYFGKLETAGFEVILSDHNGKSPYLTLYNHAGLEALNSEQQKEYVKLFVKKYLGELPKEEKDGKVWRELKFDLSLFSPNHWRPIEQQPHWKPEYNGNPHKMVLFANLKSNKGIDQELLQQVLKPKQEESTSQSQSEERKVKKSFNEILNSTSADYAERTSCVMQLHELHPYWTFEQMLDYIARNNSWANFDKEITRKNLLKVWENTKKPNPIRHEHGLYFGIREIRPKTEINVVRLIGFGYHRPKASESFKKYNDKTITLPIRAKLYYSIYEFQFGSGLNKKYFLISEATEQKNLGSNLLVLRPLMIKEIERDGKTKQVLETFGFCFPEKNLILPLCKEHSIATVKVVEKDRIPLTLEEILEKIQELQVEKPVLFKEMTPIPQSALTEFNSEDWKQIVHDFIFEGITKDPIIELTYKSDLMQPNQQIINNPKLYQRYNSHELVFTNTKTTKTTTAQKTGKLLVSARVANLLGFSTANETIQGSLNKETSQTTMDEVQEELSSELFGQLNNYMEQGQSESAKGKARVNVKGLSGLRFQGNPRIRETENESNQKEILEFIEQSLMQAFVDTLNTISKNHEAFAGRIAFIVFRKDVKSLKDFKLEDPERKLSQEDLEKNEAIVKTILKLARDNFSKLYLQQEIIDWLNEPLSKEYIEALDKIEEKAQLIPIQQFIRGHKDQAKGHVRGKALKLACVDHALSLWKGTATWEEIKEDAEEYRQQIEAQNIESLENLVNAGLSETARKVYLEKSFETLSEHLQIVLRAVKAYFLANKEVKQVGLAELEPFFECDFNKISRSKIEARALKNMGRTNGLIAKFGVAFEGTINNPYFRLTNPQNFQFIPVNTARGENAK